MVDGGREMVGGEAEQRRIKACYEMDRWQPREEGKVSATATNNRRKPLCRGWKEKSQRQAQRRGFHVAARSLLLLRSIAPSARRRIDDDSCRISWPCLPPACLPGGVSPSPTRGMHLDGGSCTRQNDRRGEGANSRHARTHARDVEVDPPWPWPLQTSMT